MSKPRNDIDLMRYVDGDLDSDQERTVAKQIVSDPQSRKVAEAVAELSEVVRTHLELEADRVPEPAFEDMWTRIERRIEAGDATAPQSDVVEAEPALKIAPPARPREVIPAPIVTQGPSFLDRARAYLLGGAVAAAAVLLLFVAVRPFERVETVQGPAVQQRAPVKVAPVRLLRSSPAEVEDLEVYQGDGMILTTPVEGEENPDTVIWIVEEDDKVKGPI